MKNLRVLLVMSGFVLLAVQAGGALAAVAGHVQFVHGVVQVTTPSGQIRTIQKGDAINEGDILTSAAEASAQLRMQDGGFIAVRPDTTLKFDQFKFSGKEDGEERSFFSLFKGGFRAVTGLIGRLNKQNYKITTPSATIGIRGTDHETYEVTPGSSLVQVAPAGAYSKVNTGETTLTTNQGTINVLPNQMGFAGGMNQVPQLQPLNTNIFTVAPAPVKETKTEKIQEKPSQQAEAGGETTGTAESGTAQTEAAQEEPVRETAVVDAAPPAATAIPAATTPVVDGGTTGTTVLAPDVVTTVPPPVVLPVDGQTVNLNNQTITTTATGQTSTVAATVATAPYLQTDLAVALAISGQSSASPFAYFNSFIAKPADINNTVPTPSFTDRYAGKDANSYITGTLNGATVGVGQAATTIAATNIQYGRYDAISAQTQVVGNVPCCTSLPPAGPVFAHWITGPAVDPVYLPEVLTTTATYTLAGGTTPTSTIGMAAGMPATLNPVSSTNIPSSLTVNFAQQMVSFTFSLTAGGNEWLVSTAGAPLEIMYWNSAKVGFRASTTAGTGWAPLAVTINPSLNVTTTGFGDVVGQLTGDALTGKALNGALLSYVLNNGAVNGNSDQVSGVAAFTGVAQNTATPYRIAGLSTIDTVIPATGPSQLAPVTMGGYNNSGSVLFDAAGNAVQFVANKSFTNGGGSVTVSPAAGATLAGLGTDPVSGISWGRWGGGTIVTDRLTNATTTLNANSSSHWIAGPVMTGPVSLPVSGTYNYVLAGGTAPTDSLGNVGTLNSATLSANFTAQTVNIGVDVTTAGAGNLVASGVNVPIQQKSFFGAATANSLSGGPNVGALTVTCSTGTCGGNIGGVFTGAGGIGAGLVYGLQNGTVIVNGVAAFHR